MWSAQELNDGIGRKGLGENEWQSANPALQKILTLTKYKELVSRQDKQSDRLPTTECITSDAYRIAHPCMAGTTAGGTSTNPDLKDAPITAQDIYNMLY